MVFTSVSNSLTVGIRDSTGKKPKFSAKAKISFKLKVNKNRRARRRRKWRILEEVIAEEKAKGNEGVIAEIVDDSMFCSQMDRENGKNTWNE